MRRVKACDLCLYVWQENDGDSAAVGRRRGGAADGNEAR